MGSNASALEILIDGDMCRAAGECVLRAPATFALGNDNTARVLPSPLDRRDVIIAAARSCPNFAISVQQDGVELV